MEAHRPVIEVQEWRPAPAPAPRRPWRKRGAIDRGVAIGLVIAMHAAGGLLFGLSAMQRGAMPSTGGSAMTVTFIESPSLVDEPGMASPSPDSTEMEIALPSLAIPEPMATFEVADPPEAIEQFRPPRMVPDGGRSLSDIALAAGVVVPKQTRVILTVDVQEDGATGKVEIAVTSGDRILDALAIEYARGIRWIPAIVQGRQSSMSIRLPVIIPMTG